MIKFVLFPHIKYRQQLKTGEALAAAGRVEIRGFGSFQLREYEGYTGRNPKTGILVDVKPKQLPFFKAGKDLKDISTRIDGVLVRRSF